MSSRYDVVVIGAGHNGLTTAAYLAKSGKKVVVVERREVIGGLAAGSEFHPGYRTAGVLHDTTTVRKWVIDDLELRKHGLETRKSAPPVFIPQIDGPGYLHFHDPRAAQKEIGAHSKQDAESHRQYRLSSVRSLPSSAAYSTKRQPIPTVSGSPICGDSARRLSAYACSARMT